jgi:hypothetical protein
MIWLVLGSSPNAPWALRAARDEQRIDKLITCNGGILLEPKPDVYFLSDSGACQMYRDHARRAGVAGTRCVTLKRCESALKYREIDWFHEFVSIEPEGYEPFQLSGCFCVEYAAHNGADVVILCGMDGYDPKKLGSDYFRADMRSLDRVTHVNLTQKCILPITKKLVAKYPKITWICYGNPLYTVESDKWIVRGL